jgi:hypothetical protein
MAAARKPYLLRVTPELWAALQRLADAELRSVNAQIEVLLRDSLSRRGIKVEQSGSTEMDQP